MACENSKNNLKIKMMAFAFLGLCVVGQLYLPIPIIKHLSQELGENFGNPSRMISAFGYSYAVGFLFFGALSDKFGKKIILLLGMSILFILTVLIVNTKEYLLIIRILQGFFAASYPPLILAYIGQSFPDKSKGLAISAMAFAFLSAVILSQLFVVYIAQSSFIQAQQILSVVYAFAIVFIGFGIQNDKQQNQVNAIEFIIKIPKVLFRQPLIPYFLQSFFVLLIFVGFYLVLAFHLKLSAQQLFAIRLAGFPAMLFTFSVPKLIRISTSNKVIGLALMVQIIGLLMSALSAYTVYFYGFLFASFLLASASALLIPTLIASVSQAACSNEKGTAIALYTFILFCGASSAPFFISVLAKYFNANHLFYCLLFISVVLLMLNGRNILNRD